MSKSDLYGLIDGCFGPADPDWVMQSYMESVFAIGVVVALVAYSVGWVRNQIADQEGHSASS